MRTLLSVLVGVVVTVVVFGALLVGLSGIGLSIGSVEAGVLALASALVGAVLIRRIIGRDARYRPTHSARTS